MKKIIIAVGLGAALAASAACSGLFTPKLCTNRFTVVDSIKVIQDSSIQVDTLATLKICTQ